jgi:hypothetical protein
MEKNETEQWKPIVGYEGQYEVSNDGRVKSLKFGREKILRGHTKKNGYQQIALSKNGVVITKLVHRLVAETWIPRVEGKDEIDHINGIRDDNRAENLRWCTHTENLDFELTKQKRQEAAKRMVEKTSRKVYVYDTNYNFLSGFTSTASASRQLNLSQGNIVNAANGSIPSYKKMIFSYIPNLTKEAYEKTLEKGRSKYEKRLKQVIEACTRWQSKHKDKVCAYQRSLYYKKKYGMTEREYKQQQLDRLDDK